MLRVLLVDDEVLVLRYLEKSICWAELNMYVAGTAVDGMKALSFILNNEVDIVLTDIKMPGMDGIDLIKKALAIKPDIYFIVLSSYNDFPLVKEAFVSGAMDYALKVDIDSENFLNVIKAAVEKIQSKGRQPLTFSIDKAMECCNESINISDVHNDLYGIGRFKQLQIWCSGRINHINCMINERRNTNLADLIKIYVENNYEKTIMLGDVAKHFKISEVYLSLIFSKKIGLRFKEYLNVLRIEKAKLLLRTTDLRISEISEQVGYSNIEHFLRVFKKSVGISPSDYRDNVLC